MPRRNPLRRRIARGAIAGALGTFAIDSATYLDMALRGRPASQVPENTVQHYAEELGVGFGSDGDKAQARRSAVAALAGYATGVTGGVVYGVFSPLLRVFPRPLRAVGLGLGVMAATDTSSTVAGATNPREWGASGWISDVLPHLVYGAVTASAFDSWSSSQRL
jgi:hypothetical protein